MSRLALLSCSEEKSSGAQPVENLADGASFYRKAALAPTDPPLSLQEAGMDIICAVDHDRSGKGQIVFRIEAVKPPRAAIFAEIGFACQVASAGSGVGTGPVGEALQPAAVGRVRPPAMGDKKGCRNAAIGDIYKLKALLA